MDRRIPVPALALLAFLATACPRQEEEGGPVERWEPEETVPYRSGAVTLKGFLVRDETLPGRRPGVLVVHDMWGQDEYTRRRARMLADLGYVAFAVDLYGEGRTAANPDEAVRMASEVSADPGVVLDRFRAAYEWLKAHEACEPSRVAAIGYGFGGNVVLRAAWAGLPLRGVVSFHGSLTLPEGALEAPVTAKVLVCHGTADRFVPVDQVEALKAAMAGAKVDLRFVEYEGAEHSFTRPEARVVAAKWRIPVGYKPAADRKSWQDMLDFLTGVFR
jgi:dienelactone hydrolase